MATSSIEPPNPVPSATASPGELDELLDHQAQLLRARASYRKAVDRYRASNGAPDAEEALNSAGGHLALAIFVTLLEHSPATVSQWSGMTEAQLDSALTVYGRAIGERAAAEAADAA